MKHFYCPLLFVVVGVSVCQSQLASSQTMPASNENSNSQIINSSTPKSQNDEEDKDIPIKNIVSGKDFLDYEDYRVKKNLVKRSDDGNVFTDIADAVLQKNGKTLFRFESTYYPTGNWLKFGLFSLLNKQNKQLIMAIIYLTNQTNKSIVYLWLYKSSILMMNNITKSFITTKGIFLMSKEKR